MEEILHQLIGGKHPIIYRVSTIQGGAEFLPSTVSIQPMFFYGILGLQQTSQTTTAGCASQWGRLQPYMVQQYAREVIWIIYVIV